MSFFWKTSKIIPRHPKNVEKPHIQGKKQVWTIEGGHWGYLGLKPKKSHFYKGKMRFFWFEPQIAPVTTQNCSNLFFNPNMRFIHLFWVYGNNFGCFPEKAHFSFVKMVIFWFDPQMAQVTPQKCSNWFFTPNMRFLTTNIMFLVQYIA